MIGVHGLAARLGDFDLRDVTFEVSAGGYGVVIGPAGSGKTTLLHLLAGVILPDRGRVEVLGTDLASLPEAGRDRFRGASVGLVFQSLNLFPHLDAEENLLAAPLLAGRKAPGDAERARSLLARVGLEGRARHRPGQMSLGEQQRVAIARALMNRPPLLLCDEPTGSLDGRRRDEVVALLREMAAENGATLLVVTHDDAVVAAFPSRLAIRDLAGGAAS
ncbi:MAG: ABC transporter ATP-binding protein [Gemmatimonadaceae bacterium]|nr:ABC transporter ATP-binding protein [Gemmatimonadaceae bacterium]